MYFQMRHDPSHGEGVRIAISDSCTQASSPVRHALGDALWDLVVDTSGHCERQMAVYENLKWCL